MDGTEKNPLSSADAARPPRGRSKKTGPLLVVVLLSLAFLGCALTWWRYSAEHPSTASAQLISPSEVQAHFTPPPAVGIHVGMKAIVSIDGHRSPRLDGRVVGAEPATGPKGQSLQVLVRLVQPVEDAQSGWPCQVTIDASIAPHLLKDANDP